MTDTPTNPLIGVWRMDRYRVHSGDDYALDGLMLMTPTHFSATHFVTVSDGPRRGCGEAGRYTVDGDTLIFHHSHFLSNGEALDGVLSPTGVMTVAAPGEEPVETCRFDLDGDALTVFFPSDNVMSFSRLS